jgi:hypothetical protein
MPICRVLACLLASRTLLKKSVGKALKFALGHDFAGVGEASSLPAETPTVQDGYDGPGRTQLGRCEAQSPDATTAGDLPPAPDVPGSRERGGWTGGHK